MTKYLQLATLVLASLVSGCIHNRIASHWSPVSIAIDGDQGDWKDALKAAKDKDIVVGVMNDNSYLYVTLSSPIQRSMLQIMRGGFTVWIDPGGRQRKVLGIRYPMGAATLGLKSEGRLRSDRGQRPDPAELLESMLSSEVFVEISGPDKDDLARVPLTSDSGIQVAIGLSDYGEFVYELRIPLMAGDSSPHAVGAASGQTIGIGFVAGGMTQRGGGRPGFGPSGGRGGRGSPMGGRSGRGGSFGGGRRGAGAGQIGQPLDHWVRVTLAGEGQLPAGR